MDYIPCFRACNGDPEVKRGLVATAVSSGRYIPLPDPNVRSSSSLTSPEKMAASREAAAAAAVDVVLGRNSILSWLPPPRLS